MRTIVTALAGIVLAGAVSVRADSTSSPVSVRVSPAVASKADSPTPPANATKKTSVGKGKNAVSTGGAGDDDSFWVEEIDLDGDGTTETTSILWDDEDKVLFLYADGDFKCASAGTGSGDMLVAINGKGNPRRRPAGSGFYVVSLDEEECGAREAASYGCRFDASGVATSCGVAVVDEQNDEITVETSSD